MRILSLVVGLSLVGCVTGEIGSTGGDDTGGDDGSGSGSGSGSQTAEPRLDLTTDNPTVNTELGTTTMITVNIDTANFTGPVNLTASVINPTTMTAVPGWTVALSQATVDVTADGIVPVVATLTIPALNGGELSGTVTIDATSSVGNKSVASTVTALNQYSMTLLGTATGQCALVANQAVTLKVNTKLRVVNKFTTNDSVIVHGIGGIPHQDQGGTGTPKDGAYEVTRTTPGDGYWWCHDPGMELGLATAGDPTSRRDPHVTWVQ